MRNDRSLRPLERGLRRPLAIAGAASVISLAVFVVGIMLIVDPTSGVRFPPSVAVIAAKPARVAVAVSPVFSGVRTARLTPPRRGGQAAAASTNGYQGVVGFKRTMASHSNSVTGAGVTVRSTAPPKPKKIVKRATSIGAVSGPNGDQGLAGGTSSAQSSIGEHSGRPSAGVPSWPRVSAS